MVLGCARRGNCCFDTLLPRGQKLAYALLLAYRWQFRETEVFMGLQPKREWLRRYFECTVCSLPIISSLKIFDDLGSQSCINII